MTEFLPTAPQQRDFSNPLLELREKKVAAWVESLPLHEAPDAIELLLQVLTPLNLEPVGDKVRLRLLERYYHPTLALHRNRALFDRQLRDLPPDQQNELREHLTELLWQLAVGYKIVVRNGAAQKRSPARDPLLHLSLHRAVEVLGLALVEAYRQYAAVPPHAYRELHQLYDFAARHDVDAVPAPLGKRQATEITLRALYKRSLLLAAADPFRLPSGAVDHLNQLLTPFADSCSLSHPPWTNARGKFLIDREKDRPPVPCAKQQSVEANEDARVLDTMPLHRAVQKHLNSVRETEKVTEEMNLLRRILPDLKAPPKRRSPRNRSVKELRVAVGLTATHYFLSSAGTARVQQTVENAAYGIEVYDAESESQVSYLLEPWRVANESPKGYLLARRHALDESLQVGEVLGLFSLRAARPQSSAEIGIIRWIKHGAEHWTHLGVEVLPGRPNAVHCLPADPTESPFEEPRALFLNRVPNLSIPPTLLGRGGLYRKDCDVMLKRENHQGRARLGSLIMETDQLVRVALKPVA